MIRNYEAPDLDAVLRVNASNVPEVGPLDAHKLGLLLDEAGLVQVVEVGGSVEGMMVILEEGGTYESANYAYFCGRHEAFAYVDRIALTPTIRGQGWGPQLYANAENWAEENLKPFLVAEVNTIPENPRSLRFHEIYGFQQIERVRPYGPDGEVVMLEKPLTLR